MFLGGCGGRRPGAEAEDSTTQHSTPAAQPPGHRPTPTNWEVGVEAFGRGQGPGARGQGPGAGRLPGLGRRPGARPSRAKAYSRVVRAGNLGLRNDQ